MISGSASPLQAWTDKATHEQESLTLSNTNGWQNYKHYESQGHLGGHKALWQWQALYHVVAYCVDLRNTSDCLRQEETLVIKREGI